MLNNSKLFPDADANFNAGFDSKIKVYDLPNSKSGETSIGGIADSGDKATAYLVVKNGESF